MAIAKICWIKEEDGKRKDEYKKKEIAEEEVKAWFFLNNWWPFIDNIF